MAHNATRLDVRQTSESRRVQFGVVRGNFLKIEHAGLFTHFLGRLGHGAILSQPKISASNFNPGEFKGRSTTESAYSRSSARHPISVR